MNKKLDNRYARKFYRPKNKMAKALEDGLFRQRVVPDKKKIQKKKITIKEAYRRLSDEEFSNNE